MSEDSTVTATATLTLGASPLGAPVPAPLPALPPPAPLPALPPPAPIATLPPRSLRLTGTADSPRWRGRLHLLAAGAAVPAGAALVARRPSPAVAVYVVGLVSLYAISSGYHLLPLAPIARRRLRQADHATIYLFTAASVTPFCALAVGGGFGDGVTALAWAGAVAGVVIKVRGFDRAHALGAALYMALGWLSAITFPAALGRLDATEVALLGGTALFYTAGAVVLFSRRPDPVPHVFGYHEVWHAAVVAASACYFLLIWSLTGPAR